MGKKHLAVTYFLWLFFGWSGLHHFYLGRDKQAFVWWSTFGGFFYMGWVRDFWRIPEYVDDANDEKDFIETLKRKWKLRRNPPFNTSRFLGEFLVGYFYGLLVRSALPDNIVDSWWRTCFLVSLGISLGVYLVGNIGRETGQFSKCHLVTVLSYTLLSILTDEEPNYICCSIASACAFNYHRQYRSENKKLNFSTRIGAMLFGGFVVLTLWTSFFYFNAEIRLENGEKIKLEDSLRFFFKSPAWLDFRNTMWQLYYDSGERHWQENWDHFVKSFDPTGEANAYKILGIPVNASNEEIRKMYKQLVRKWHPDKHKTDDSGYVQERFMEIQEAYELLSERRKTNWKPKTYKTEF